MADSETVDQHLAAMIDQVVSAIQSSKQAIWPASTTERRRELNELKSFLGEQLAALSDAEQRIDGRAAIPAPPAMPFATFGPRQAATSQPSAPWSSPTCEPLRQMLGPAPMSSPARRRRSSSPIWQTDWTSGCTRRTSGRSA